MSSNKELWKAFRILNEFVNDHDPNCKCFDEINRSKTAPSKEFLKKVTDDCFYDLYQSISNHVDFKENGSTN